MKLHFTQSGGYAGLIRGISVDTNTLPDSEGQRLEELLNSSGLLETPAVASSRARDALQYELVVEDGNVTRTFVFDDTTKPPDAAPLLRELKAKAKPQPP